MGLFGGDSDSETNQTNTQKDNSALLEGEGLNITDGGRGVRGEGVFAEADSEVLRQSGFSFGGARKGALSADSALVIAAGAVVSIWLIYRNPKT